MSTLVDKLTELAQQAHLRAIAAIQDERELCQLIENTAPGHVVAFDDARSETLVEILEAGRRAGEDLFEVAERMMIVALGVKYNWVQLDMARRIGVSPRVLNYKLASYRMRPKDRKRWAA